MFNHQIVCTQRNATNNDATPINKNVFFLQQLLHVLALQGYRFTTVTPVTHQRFLARSNGIAKNLREVFGWSLPFKTTFLPPQIFDLMSQANLIIHSGGLCYSKIRVSSLHRDLFLHSRFPTDHEQSVFFGPDTYRFAAFIQRSLKALQCEQEFSSPDNLNILDVGCGSGAGGITAVRALSNQQKYELTLNDVNPVAIDYAAACVQEACVPTTLLSGDFFNIRNLLFNLIISNPPFIRDPDKRLYRDGGAIFGLELSVRIVKHALDLLAPGGCLLLYTGVAMTSDERNPLLAELMPHFSSGNFRWFFEEIDPDIFSEELERPEYESVNRIAAIGLKIVRIR